MIDFFCRIKYHDYLCPVKKIRFGSIAQLVQSICLTSRGPAVRIRLLPQRKSRPCEEKCKAFFLLLQFACNFVDHDFFRFSKIRGYQEIKQTKNSVVLIVTQRTTEDAQRHTEDKLKCPPEDSKLFFGNFWCPRKNIKKLFVLLRSMIFCYPSSYF